MKTGSVKLLTAKKPFCISNYFVFVQTPPESREYVNIYVTNNY